MAQLDIEKIGKLLRNHQIADAKAMFEEFFAAPLRPEERAGAQLAIAAAYMEFKTEINETYNELLVDALVRLKKVNEFERKVKDEIDLARVNAEIDILSKKS